MIPNLKGLTVDEVRHRLAPLVAQAIPVYEASSDTAPGIVLGTDPEPGARVDPDAAVMVYVSAGPDTGGHAWASHVARRHRKTVLGVYRGSDGAPVLALGPEADLDAWQERLEASAAGKPFGLDRCPVGPIRLKEIAREIHRSVEAGELRHRGVGFGVDPATCSVLVEGSFPWGSNSIAQLYERYGELVTIVDGMELELLRGWGPPTPASHII